MNPFWPAVIAGTVAAGSTITYGIHGRSASVFGPSVYHGNRRRRSMALTFDDGPSEGSLALIEYFASENIKATFFQCGMNVERHPKIARAIAAAGHELGNHTYSHARLCPRIGWKLNLRSPANIYNELVRTQEAISLATGIVPTLFRAPYGMRWYGLSAAQKRLHLLGVMWTVIGHDWEWPASAITEFVIQRASPGGIICLHDGRDIRPNADLSDMLSSVKQIVPALKERGYAFETVSQLIK